MEEEIRQLNEAFKCDVKLPDGKYHVTGMDLSRYEDKGAFIEIVNGESREITKEEFLKKAHIA